MLRVTVACNGTLWNETPCDSVESLNLKLEQAKETWEMKWRHTTLEERKQCVLKFAELIEKNVKLLAQIMAKECGKPIEQGVETCQASKYRIEYFLSVIDELLAEKKPYSAAMSDFVAYEPKGVVGLILPFNFPVLMMVDFIVPALLTGNCVMIKPSEHATMIGLEIHRLLSSALQNMGNVVQFCIGASDVGQAFSKLKLDSLVFVGSSQVGTEIVKNAHPLVPVALELGGNDGFYVSKCCVLESTTLDLATGTFSMQGQVCNACERIYVHEDIFEQFLEKYVQNVKGMTLGDPLEEDTEIGPLISETLVDKMEAFVKDALEQGATLQCGGQRCTSLPPGLEPNRYFEPTVLTATMDMSKKMKLVNDETFGPVVILIKVPEEVHQNPRQIAQLLDSSKHGLTAGVFANPDESGAKFAREILRHVNCGTVYFNKCGLVQPWMPWAGRNESGRGVILGREGLVSCFLNTKSYYFI